MKINKKQIIKKIQKDLRKDFGVLFELKSENPEPTICDMKIRIWLEDKLKDILNKYGV